VEVAVEAEVEVEVEEAEVGEALLQEDNQQGASRPTQWPFLARSLKISMEIVMISRTSAAPLQSTER
jgi:hypothetical protein